MLTEYFYIDLDPLARAITGFTGVIAAILSGDGRKF